MAKHKLTMAEVERQALVTKARPLWTLPASWRDPQVAENMADWIKQRKNSSDKTL